MRPAVVRSSLPWRDPESVVRHLAATDDVVWRDAGLDASRGRSIVGWGRPATGDVRDGGADRLWQAVRDDLADVEPGSDPLGWAGWLGYGFGCRLIDRDATAGHRPAATSATTAAEGDAPDVALLDVDRALVFDHAARSVEAVARAGDPWPGRVAETWGDVPVEPPVPGPTRASSGGSDTPTARWRHRPGEYLDLIDRCRRAITAGEAYQLCLTTAVDVAGGVDALEAFAHLRRSSPAPHASFVRIGDVSVVGASPESFVEVSTDGLVSSSPIKGTRRRGSGADDASLALELLESEKERAENVMIVDLVRNDLARVARLGSVEVVELLAVHSYEHVHQLVSTVRARLAPGRTATDVVEAAFPAGSMTGAPKRRAVELLAGFEGAPRGVYSGATGWLGRDGSAHLAMVIRSIEVHRALAAAPGRPARPAGARVGVGGGITISSVPADERDEVELKAAALLAVLGVSAADGGPVRMS
ncbi:para-aminobenzoate synthetase component 1 [Frigoribacterium sp. PvP054]|uniref:anthranilate synthase component I family protein n=1 Tax=Frigoribacterium sp. PvP054 TaxID=3156438 RepID=UPI003395A054